jgi:hypothetical protein
MRGCARGTRRVAQSMRTSEWNKGLPSDLEFLAYVLRRRKLTEIWLFLLSVRLGFAVAPCWMTQWPEA